MRLSTNGGRQARDLWFYADILSLLAAAAVFFPLLLSTRYSLFHGDDFSFYPGTVAEPVQNLLSVSLANAWKTYNTWQGTWLTNVLNVLLNPLHRYSYRFLRLSMMGWTLAAFLCLFFLARSLCRFFDAGRRAGVLTALFLIPYLCRREYCEVYLWHVGAMAYLVPMTLQVLGLALILGRPGETRSGLFFGCLCLFLSGGGVLLIGGLGASLTLLLVLTCLLEDRRPERRFVLAFLAVLAGTLVNVAAPGNYAKTSLAGSVAPLFSLRVAAAVVLGEFFEIMKASLFAASLIVSFLIGWAKGKRLRAGTLTLAAVGLALTPVVTVYPVVLGYHMDMDADLSSRFWFVIDGAIIFCALLAAALFGSQLRALRKDGPDRGLRRALALLAAAALLVGLFGPGDRAAFLIAENLRNGKLETYSRQWRELFDAMSESPGENIIAEVPDPCFGVMPVQIAASPDSVVNISIAHYFCNESLMDAWYAFTWGAPENAQYLRAR